MPHMVTVWCMAIELPKNNAVIYARFSPRRNSEDCESVEQQLEKCRAYCKAMDYAIIGEEFDKAKSGKDRTRDGLTKAMDRAKVHKAVLVVRDLARLTRDVRDALDIREELFCAGAGLADLETRMDTAGPMGECLMTIKAAFDKLQRVQTAIKTSDMLRWKQRAGQCVSRFPPYGWKIGREEVQHSGKIKRIMVQDDDEQDALRRIKKWRKEGMSLHRIRIRLGEEQMKCRGKAWHINTITRILDRDRRPV